MANIVKVNESGTELIKYLQAVASVQQHYQEAVDIKENLLLEDKKAQRISAKPEDCKPVISRKMVVVLALIALFCFGLGTEGGATVVLLGIAILAFIGYYIFSRIRLSKEATKVQLNRWNAEVEQKEQTRANVAANLPDVDALIKNCSYTLTKLYNVGPLHPDYRNLPACATFYDWFSKGMTASLSRNGSDPGAYVMYEEKLRHGELMSELRAIRKDISAIRQTQAYLYDVMVDMNNTVKNISQQLVSIQFTSALTAISSMQTAANTSQIAANSSQIAANSAQIKNNSAVSAYYSKVNANNSAALNRYVGLPGY